MAIACLALLHATPLWAQYAGTPTPRGGSRAAALAINAGLGMSTTALSRLLAWRGERKVPLWRSVLAGGAAGATIFAGKTIAAGSCDGCGLVGRQVAALGGSVMTNAVLGRAELEELVLPVGPLRLHVRGRTAGGAVNGAAPRSPVWLAVDLPGTVALAWLVSRDDQRLDLGASFSAGAPVLLATGQENVAEQLFGVIMIDELRGLRWNGEVDRITLGHEAVHVLQYDQRTAMWSAPAEQWIARRSTIAGRVLRYVDIGLVEPVWQAFAFDAPYERRLTEREAWLLAGPRPTVRPAGR